MWRPDPFLALPEDVIAFAWSAPMRELTATMGISDVAHADSIDTVLSGQVLAHLYVPGSMINSKMIEYK